MRTTVNPNTILLWSWLLDKNTCILPKFRQSEHLLIYNWHKRVAKTKTSVCFNWITVSYYNLRMNETPQQSNDRTPPLQFIFNYNYLWDSQRYDILFFERQRLSSHTYQKLVEDKSIRLKTHIRSFTQMRPSVTKKRSNRTLVIQRCHFI